VVSKHCTKVSQGLYIFILTLFGMATASSQNKLPPIVEITDDSMLHYEIPFGNWQTLADKDRKLTINEILQPINLAGPQFYSPKDSKVDYSIRTIWIRFRMKNGMTRQARIAFTSNSQNSDFYFVKEQGGIIHETNGLMDMWSKLGGLKQARALPM
jgi:hypothetical protein